jgi:hypothetical protein
MIVIYEVLYSINNNSDYLWTSFHYPYGLVFTILWKKCAFIVDHEIALTLVPENQTS